MKRNEFKRFVREWLRFAIKDASAQTFGWPTVVSAVLLAYILKRMGVESIQSQIGNGLAVAVVSWLVALAFAFFTAGMKAYWMVKPISVTVTDNLVSPTFSFTDGAKGYNATAIVINRSNAHIKDCVAYVMNAPQADGKIHPRYVEQFDLPPGAKKLVHFGYWFSRQSPHCDDPDINLSGPTSAGFSGNRCKVASPFQLHLRIQAQDIDVKDIHRSLSIDRDIRRLRVSISPDSFQ